MNLIVPQSNSHWYRATDQGIQSFYEMRGKNGKMRAPTIADAREQGLLVSISRISQILPRPHLESWKQTQAIISALTLPRKLESFDDYCERWKSSPARDENQRAQWCYCNPPKPLEAVDAFAKRVVKDMETQGNAAMGFGSRIHAQIELEMLSPGAVYSDEIEPFMVGVRTWLQENVSLVIGAEQIVGDARLGIGGKLDLLCELNMPGSPVGVVDFKTQGIKNGGAFYYKSWALQLAGYGHCVKEKEAYKPWPMLVSVVIDSNKPGPAHFKVWEEPESHWGAFLNCLEMFCYDNDYRPGKL